MKFTTKHKYATIGFTYFFGLICASFLNSIACFVVFAVIGILLGLSAGRSDIFLKLSMIFIAASFLVTGLCKLILVDSVISLAGSRGTVKGIVTECYSPDNDTVRMVVSGTADGKPAKLILFSEDSGIAPGDSVEFEAVFSEFRDSAMFAESSYYYSKGVFVKSYAVSDIAVTAEAPEIAGFVSYVSGYFKNAVDNLFSDNGGGIIKAMFFGDKSDLSAMVKTDIKHSGISHLTAVSGMHLSLMVHIFAGFAAMFFRRGGRRYFALIAVYILFLMTFFGMTASVMRSGFMMIVFYGSELVHRKSDTLCSVGAALFVILVLNPFACRDTGLMLSVVGTIGVGVIAPKVAEILRIRRFGLFVRALFPSFCASLCTMPLGALCFGGISYVAPVTCLLVQPFFTVILVLVPISAVLPFLSGPVLFVAGWAARIMEHIARFMGSTVISYTETDETSMIIFMALLVSGTALTWLVIRKTRPAVQFAMLMVCAFAMSQTLYEVIGYDDIKLNIIADNGNPVVCVEDRTGVSFYMLSVDSGTADIIYEYGHNDPAFICAASDAAGEPELLRLSTDVHLPESGSMEYDVSGGYRVIVNDGRIILKIRGITVEILPAGYDTSCDIAVYKGYKEKYGNGGNIATILCDRKYYNCGDAVNAFLYETEIVIDSQGRYAVCVK